MRAAGLEVETVSPLEPEPPRPLPPEKELRRMCAVLGLPVSEFLEESPDGGQPPMRFPELIRRG